MSDKIPVSVVPASQSDIKATKDWQTSWTSSAAKEMPNKVALHRTDDGELRKYYMQEFGAMPVGHYDPYRLVIWEDAAANILSDFEEV